MTTAEMNTTTVTTPLGRVKGSDLGDHLRFAGIRYAAAPVGPRRFLPPKPVQAWSDVYDATATGPVAPQPPPTPAPWDDPQTPTRDESHDEDCLFLNVYTPALDGRSRPVLVWIHGGGYESGAGHHYDGAPLCRATDSVVVTINYRLGVLGWLPLGHLDPELAGSGNNGLRDQIEALRWVQQNIASFGGDPGNVTLFGESAGGGSVGAILTVPEAEGLHHRAAILSGAPLEVRPPDPDNGVLQRVLTGLGAPADPLAALRTASTEDLITAQISARGDGALLGFRPTIDGAVLTRTLRQTIADRGTTNVPLVIGTNRDELGWAMATSDDEATRQKSEAATAGVFRMPALRVAEAQADTPVPVWVYYFTWPSPAFDGRLGAIHSLELPFLFASTDRPPWNFFVGDAPPHHLTDVLQGVWRAFAHTGVPSDGGLAVWPPYESAKRPTLVIDDEVAVVDDPDADLRRRWADANDERWW